jgi:plastocyanin
MRAVALLLACVLAAGGTGAAVAPAHSADKHAKRKHARQAKHRCKRRGGKRRCSKPRRSPLPSDETTTPAGAPGTTAPSSVGGGTGTPPAPAPRPLGHLQVIAREFSFTASRLTLAAGTVAIELNNRGQDPHDLRVERADDAATGFDFALTKPSTLTSRKLELTPGTWKLYCTLPGHDQAGMHATVTVSG